jgi:hypothetical protein
VSSDTFCSGRQSDGSLLQEARKSKAAGANRRSGFFIKQEVNLKF